MDEEVTQLHRELPLFTTSVVLHHGQVSGSSDLQGLELMREKKEKSIEISLRGSSSSYRKFYLGNAEEIL